MKRWLVSVDEVQLERLSPEDRKLGTLVRGENGEDFLVFLDDFVALKVATSLGAKREIGRTAPAHAELGNLDKPLATFDNGDILIRQHG